MAQAWGVAAHSNWNLSVRHIFVQGDILVDAEVRVAFFEFIWAQYSIGIVEIDASSLEGRFWGVRELILFSNSHYCTLEFHGRLLLAGLDCLNFQIKLGLSPARLLRAQRA